jgi:HipA-like C-terminal domain
MVDSVGGLPGKYVGADNWRLRRQEWFPRALPRNLYRKSALPDAPLLGVVARGQNGGRIVAEADKDARELFRRICFNALISSIDDHPRNHALLARNVDWALSPAYDLTSSPLVSLDRPRSGAGVWRSRSVRERENYSFAARPLFITER